MMMNCFCSMVHRRKAFSLICSRDYCQISSSSRISDTPRAGFEPAQNLSSGFIEWSCAVGMSERIDAEDLPMAVSTEQLIEEYESSHDK